MATKMTDEIRPLVVRLRKTVEKAQSFSKILDEEARERIRGNAREFLEVLQQVEELASAVDALTEKKEALKAKGSALWEELKADLKKVEADVN